jgi:hypothetical protein
MQGKFNLEKWKLTEFQRNVSLPSSGSRISRARNQPQDSAYLPAASRFLAQLIFDREEHDDTFCRNVGSFTD